MEIRTASRSPRQRAATGGVRGRCVDNINTSELAVYGTDNSCRRVLLGDSVDWSASFLLNYDNSICNGCRVGPRASEVQSSIRCWLDRRVNELERGFVLSSKNCRGIYNRKRSVRAKNRRYEIILTNESRCQSHSTNEPSNVQHSELAEEDCEGDGTEEDEENATLVRIFIARFLAMLICLIAVLDSLELQQVRPPVYSVPRWLRMNMPNADRKHLICKFRAATKTCIRFGHKKRCRLQAGSPEIA